MDANTLVALYQAKLDRFRLWEGVPEICASLQVWRPFLGTVLTVPPTVYSFRELKLRFTEDTRSNKFEGLLVLKVFLALSKLSQGRTACCVPGAGRGPTLTNQMATGPSYCFGL